MKINRHWFSFLLLALLALSACQPAVSVTQTLPPSASPTQTVPAPSVTASSDGVRTCDYLPGQSQPAQIPGSSQPAANPGATPITFNQSSVDANTIASQQAVFDQIVKDINDHYFSLDYNGVDWNSVQDKYKLLIQNGLKQADFYQAMKQMVSALGDQISFYATPSEQATQTALGSSGFVGIGVAYGYLNVNGEDRHVVNWVYSGSPAEQAGIKIHDALLKVDGGPFLDENGTPRALGQEGSSVTITVQTPGQAPRDLKLVRRGVNLPTVVDDCLVNGTSIGYIRWFDINNSETTLQTITALKQMSAGSSLQGLIIDLRASSGADISNLQRLLSLFTGGNLGSFIAPRGDSAPVTYTADPADINGSQKLPLVVLQDQDTSGAPLSSGVLQLDGRARIVGQTADGVIYGNFSDNLPDGSFLSIANVVFQPAGKTPDYWKKTGVVPDFPVNGHWDQYTEANDPYLAKAIDELMKK